MVSKETSGRGWRFRHETSMAFIFILKHQHAFFAFEFVPKSGRNSPSIVKGSKNALQECHPDLPFRIPGLDVACQHELGWTSSSWSEEIEGDEEELEAQLSDHVSVKGLQMARIGAVESNWMIMHAPPTLPRSSWWELEINHGLPIPHLS